MSTPHECQACALNEALVDALEWRLAELEREADLLAERVERLDALLDKAFNASQAASEQTRRLLERMQQMDDEAQRDRPPAEPWSTPPDEWMGTV